MKQLMGILGMIFGVMLLNLLWIAAVIVGGCYLVKWIFGL